MHKLALKLGLTVLLQIFVVANVLDWLPFSMSSIYLYVLGGLALSWVLATLIAPRVVADEAPPVWITWLLIALAGLMIVLLIASLRYLFAMYSWRPWILLAVMVLTIGHLRPRMMLFAGVVSFVMQLGLLQLLGLLGLFVSLPKAVFFCLNLLLAVLVARWLCLGEESPADRAKNPNWLWFFGAAGVAALLISQNGLSFLYSWAETCIWAAFLLSFLLLAHHLEPDDPTHVPSALGADLLLLLMVFVGLYLTTGTVFHVSEIVMRKLPLRHMSGFEAWLPALITAALAIVIMIGMKLGSRLRNDNPGRGLLRWGTIFFVVSLIAGGSIMGSVDANGPRLELLAELVSIAIMVGPLMLLTQFLLGVGLLRAMFHLDTPRPD